MVLIKWLEKEYLASEKIPNMIGEQITLYIVFVLTVIIWIMQLKLLHKQPKKKKKKQISMICRTHNLNT